MRTTYAMVTLTDDISGKTSTKIRGYATESPDLVVTPQTWAEVDEDGQIRFQTSPDMWAITHRPSGKRIGPYWYEPEDLIALAERLAQVGDCSVDNPLDEWSEDLLAIAETLVDDFREERGIHTVWR